MNDDAHAWDDGEGAGASDARAGYPVDPGRLWITFKRHWKWIPIVAGISAALASTYALLRMQITFQSETSMVWEPTDPDRNTRELSTLAGVLTLPGTLSKLKKKLKLKQPVEVLEKQIEVWFDTRSNLVTVVAKSHSGASAAQLANSLVEVFLDQQVELGRTRAMESASLLIGDLSAAQSALSEIRVRYDDMRKAHGIVDFEVEFAQTLQAVNELARQRESATSASRTLKARATTLSALSKSRPHMRVQTSTRSNPGAVELAQLRAELASASARLSADHPQILRLKSRVAALARSNAAPENSIANVVSTANPELEQLRARLSSAQTDRAAQEERAKALGSAEKQARQHLSTLSGIEAEARSLLKEIDVAERRVDDLRRQLGLVREAERATAPEFRVLSKAPIPPYAIASKRRVVVVGVTLGAVLLVVLVLIFRTVRDGRIYTAREAAFWSKLPVVASSHWPQDQRLFHRFMDELNDYATRTTGTTLIVSAAQQGTSSARQLADWLGPTPRAESMEEKSVIGTATEAITVTASEQATTLATHDDAPQQVSFHAWRGELDGPDLRRASRLADRVLVLIGSGDELFTRLTMLQTQLGRETGVALIVHGVPEEMTSLPDRVGDADKFWGTS